MARRPIKIKSASLKRQKLLGLADLTGREIIIDFTAHQNEKELLDTICHEVLHVASDDFLSEKAVDNMAQDLADVLFRLKYRRFHQ